MKNLAFHSLWKIIQQILTILLMHFSLKGWKNVFFEPGSGRVKVCTAATQFLSPPHSPRGGAGSSLLWFKNNERDCVRRANLEWRLSRTFTHHLPGSEVRQAEFWELAGLRQRKKTTVSPERLLLRYGHRFKIFQIHRWFSLTITISSNLIRR